MILITADVFGKRLSELSDSMATAAGRTGTESAEPEAGSFRTDSLAKTGFNLSVREKFLISFRRKFNLSGVALIPGSETVYASEKILSRNEYIINYEKSEISFSGDYFPNPFDTLIVYYEVLRLSLNKEYSLNELKIKDDTANGDTVYYLDRKDDSFSSVSVFGSGMKKSGTIYRGFNIGTNKDLTVNSGLRLELSGNLTEDIKITAALTDESSPIQPEGNTERLDELDKVFIQIQHKYATGTFGDFDLRINTGEFGKTVKKLQGLKAEFDYEGYKGFGAIASSRGKFNSLKIQGQDGTQGPYRLYGAGNERNIIVISGSERVFLDGQELTRGEPNDYTIDYASAQVTFTTKRLITSNSRITVDFEYTDRQYERNFTAGGADVGFFGNKIKLGVSYFREADNQDALIDFSLTDEEKKILENAGDDISKTMLPGYLLVLPDSSGIRKGQYVRIDTLINGKEYIMFKYAPGSQEAVYQVKFTNMGSGKGDYSRVSLGVYEFTGIDKGDYLPVRFIPLPKLQQNMNISISAEPLENIRIGLDLGLSSIDKNRFSSIDDKDNNAYARKAEIDIKKVKLETGFADFGEISFKLKERFIEERYAPVDRINSVEFEREYNTGPQLSNKELLREASAEYKPLEILTLNGGYGLLKKGNVFTSERYKFGGSLLTEDGLRISNSSDYVRTSGLSQNSKWFRHRSEGTWSPGLFEIGTAYEGEDRRERQPGKDSLLGSGIIFNEYSAFVNYNSSSVIGLRVSAGFRKDFIPLKGKFSEESESLVQEYLVEYKGGMIFSADFSLKLRDKNYSKAFSEEGAQDSKTVLVRSFSRSSLFNRGLDMDLLYEASTQKSARYERVFIKTEPGLGNYIYLGDLNGDGIQNENEFEPSVYDADYIVTTLPTEKLFPVIDLKTNLRIRADFGQLFSNKGGILGLLSILSSETLIRIEENSKEENLSRIYLMNFKYFRNDSTTIRGNVVIMQDVDFFRNNRDYSFRLRFYEKKSLNQFSGGNEKAYYREKALRIKFALMKEIMNQTDFTNTSDMLNAETNSSRSRKAVTNEISTDFTYFPFQSIELGMKFQVARTTDAYPVNPTVIDRNNQLLRIVFSIAGQGKIRLEGERTELNSQSDNLIPYELTKGSRIGKNYIWRLNADYKLAENLQANVNYEGRIPAGSSVINNLRAEVRAYF